MYYSSIFGISGVFDILGSILISKRPEVIVLTGTCYLTKEVSKPTIVIPRYAETELLDFKGKADEKLIEIAKEISEKKGFYVIISNNHLTKLSFLETFDKEKEKEALSVDMETSIVYYLANRYKIPVVSILGVSDHRTRDGKIRFIGNEDNLRNETFKTGLELLKKLKNL